MLCHDGKYFSANPTTSGMNAILNVNACFAYRYKWYATWAYFCFAIQFNALEFDACNFCFVLVFGFILHRINTVVILCEINCKAHLWMHIYISWWFEGYTFIYILVWLVLWLVISLSLFVLTLFYLSPWGLSITHINIAMVTSASALVGCDN